MSKYSWLKTVGQLPRTVEEGLKILGTVEAPGPANNPKILAWAKELGLSSSYSADSIPWCGLAAAIIVTRAGKNSVQDPLWARNWLKFGIVAPAPSLGDVLVFSRGSGGHVGIYIAEDATAYHVLGGNQSDAVTITRIAKNRLLGARRPIYKNKPESVKPYKIAATGALSTNEA